MVNKMRTKLSNKKAKKPLDSLNEKSTVYIDGEENGFFEEGALVSSPLRNEMHRFRYYVVISTKKNKNFTVHQKNLAKDKFRDISESCGSKIEEKNKEIVFSQNYALIKILIPFNKPVGEVIEGALEPLSNNGGFLRFHYLVTNTHKPTSREIKDYLKTL